VRPLEHAIEAGVIRAAVLGFGPVERQRRFPDEADFAAQRSS